MRHLSTGLIWGGLLAIAPPAINSASAQDQFCQQFGAEAVITTSKVFVTTMPASTFVAKPEAQRGCVIRRKHWAELRRGHHITPAQESHCSKPSNTFAYALDKDGIKTTSCVDHIDNKF
ncbi:DUF3172 domain-containing protein [Synechococcus sp. RS9916]|uniref:DUF3172 domain-containing protein n=1 Tax=Synechococcus sp. RS9916 TaxID=221359 RepID=UPI0000E53E47|nr:DUF3172 domain-containing protein [Synechococcus sp. RS9916]EAU73065.1 hypothetical protein RS9916_26179 [Synechococcus sp. RS9916]